MCDLNDAFDLSQPTISHHLKVAARGRPARPHEAGGVWVFYAVRPGALSSLGCLIGSVESLIAELSR